MPMGDSADGGRIMEERLTVLEHPASNTALERRSAQGPMAGAEGCSGVVRPTLDPEEGWGCGWTPQTLTTLHFPRPRWRSAAATPC